MTDSRIGTFGGAALVLSLVLRVIVLADLIDALEAFPSALVLIAAAPLSRLAGLLPLMLLANAKPDGKAAAVGRPSPARYLTALLIGLMITSTLLWFATEDATILLAIVIFGLLSTVPLLRLSQRLIGGQTGDVAGAAQQISELAQLLTLSALIV
jgi:adenosylcobinamide-GDP ribazoletransferase